MQQVPYAARVASAEPPGGRPMLALRQQPGPLTPRWGTAWASSVRRDWQDRWEGPRLSRLGWTDARSCRTQPRRESSVAERRGSAKALFSKPGPATLRVCLRCPNWKRHFGRSSSGAVSWISATAARELGSTPFQFCPWCGGRLEQDINVEGSLALRIQREETGLSLTFHCLDELAREEIVAELLEFGAERVRERRARDSQSQVPQDLTRKASRR